MFRYRAKKVFLTYPQCSTDKNVALARIQTLLEPYELKWAVVGHELHKDKGHHLHVVAATKSMISTRKANFFDVVCDKHPNIVNPRYLAKTVAYVTKDGDFVCFQIDPEEFIRLALNKENSGFNQFARLIHGGSTLSSLDELDPGFMMKNLRRVREYYGFVSGAKRRAMTPPVKWVAPTFGTTGLLTEVAEWFSENIKKPRHLGQPNLWLHGGTGIGKTFLKELLMTMLRVYEAPYDNDWHDEYLDGAYDIVVFDEFNGQHTITHMNRWLGSEATKLRRRGIAPVTKKDRLPCLVLSNHSPASCYSKVSSTYNGTIAVGALSRRVDIIDIGNEKIPQSFFEAFGEKPQDEIPVPARVSISSLDLDDITDLGPLEEFDSTEFRRDIVALCDKTT